MKRIPAFLILSLLSLGFAPGDDKELAQPQTLKDIKGISTRVVLNDNALIVHQVATKWQISSQVETRLQTAALPLSTKAVAGSLQGHPELIVVVNSVTNSAGVSASHVVAELLQDVRLERSPGVITRGTTWQSSHRIFIRGFDSDKDLENAVADVVDEFINAYFSVNLK